jgi:hypothetical protein
MCMSINKNSIIYYYYLVLHHITVHRVNDTGSRLISSSNHLVVSWKTDLKLIVTIEPSFWCVLFPEFPLLHSVLVCLAVKHKLLTWNLLSFPIPGSKWPPSCHPVSAYTLQHSRWHLHASRKCRHPPLDYTVLQTRRPQSQHSRHGKSEQLHLINIIRQTNSSALLHNSIYR